MNSSKQYAYEIKLIIKNLNKISGLPECDPYKEELNRKCQCEGPAYRDFSGAVVNMFK